MTSKKSLLLGLVALFGLMPAYARAQVTTATLAGVVTDQSSATVPGATVSARNVETDVSRMTVTDNEGRYRLPGLEPGTYEVTVELQGFQKIKRGDVQLSVGQNAGLDLVLSVGKIEDVITVTGETSVIDTTRSAVSAVVDSRQIRELPLNGRDFSQLTLLQPGVLGSPTTSRQVDRGMGTQVSIAGARPNQISYQLDGTDVNFQGNGSPGSAAGGLLGVETVREFQVLVNNYSAEYGRSSGGIVTAVTRSGTNSFRGAGFEFHRNDALDARNYFDPPDVDQPPLHRNQYGGYLGGPLARERTFFFTSYEGLHQDRGFTSTSFVPSRATRNRTDIAASVRPYMDLFPLPNGAENGAIGIYTEEVVEPTRENYFVGKIDHSAGQNHSFSLRYSWDKASVIVAQQLPLFAIDTNTKAQFIVGEHKWIISPALLNVVKVAWNKAYEATENVNNIADPTNLYFIPNTQFGSLGVTGLTSLGPDTNTPTFIDLKSLQIAQSLTWSRGAHALKGGVNFTRWFNDQDSSFTIGGRYAFNSVDNFVRGVANTFEGQAPGSSTDRKWRQNLVGLFVQDDWSARRNLTINAGLRYEFITVPTEVNDKVGSMPDLYAPEGPTTGRPLFNNPSLKNFAPRVGANWNIDGKGKNVVQAGGGMFYEPILSNVYRAYGNRTPPFYNTINPSTPPFPNPVGAGATTALLRLDLLDYNLKNPYRVQYNATYNRQLAAQTVVTVGFLGARGYNQIRNIEWNQAVPQILPDGSYLFPVNRVRRNPNFASMRLRTTDGRSWYKALIVGARRRFSNNLDMQASYTWGKSEDLGSQAVGSGDFDNSFQPAYWEDPYLNKGPSDYDIRHNFVFNYMWQLPEADGNGIARAITHGWQLAGIVTMRSGVPFSPELSFDRARALPRSGGAGQRPNLAAGASANPVLGGPHQYYDPLAFELPEAGTLGNLPRNTIIGPGYASWDGSLIRNIAMGGVRRLQLRLEAFNILNRANFGLPVRTVFDSATTRVANAGEITTTVTPGRQFQLGVKFEF